MLVIFKKLSPIPIYSIEILACKSACRWMVECKLLSFILLLIAESMTLYKPDSHPSPAITMSCCSLHTWWLFLSHWGLRKREKCTTVQSHEGESVWESHTLYIYLLMMSPSHEPSDYSFFYNHPHWLFMNRSWIAELYHFVFVSLIGAIKDLLFRLVLLTVC